MPRFPVAPAVLAIPAVLTVLAAVPAPAQNLVPEKGFYATDDVVQTLRVVGDSLYVGGRFTHVGRRTGPLAPLSISSGTTLSGFPEANGQITGIAADGSGGWFVGGDFDEIGGVPRNHVAHVLPDLTVDPAWDADANYPVHGFAVHDSTLYLHGTFSTIGGEPRFRLASVGLATGAVTDWDPGPSGGGIEDFHLDGDLLYVVGSFATIAGEPRDMAAFDLPTGELTDFDPVITNDVLAVAVRNDVVYVGGRFSTAGDSTRSRLAAFDANTAEVLPWDPDVLGSGVFDLDLADTTLFAGGAFSFVGGEEHRSVVEIGLASGEPLNTIGGTTGLVVAVLVHGDSVYVGGDFTTLDSQDRRFLGGFDRNTGAVLDTPSPLDEVTALAATGDTLYVGGKFPAAVGVDRDRFAAFHANTLDLLPWAPSFQNIVWEIEPSPGNDTLYVSGRFITVDGAPRERIASFDLATGALTSFSPEVDGDVYDFCVADSLLYLGGSFNVVNGNFRYDMATVNRVTGGITPWNPGSYQPGFVNAIVAWNDTVWVGGSFAHVADSTRINLAAIDGTTGDVLDWGGDIVLHGTPTIDSFFPLDHPSYPNGALFLGGDFLNLEIGLRRGVAALHRNTGNQVYPWNPYLQDSYECKVTDYALVDGLLYVAGDFDGVFNNGARDVAAIDVVTGEANSWIVDAWGAGSVAVSDSMVFVGGNNNDVGRVMHGGLAAFRRDSEPPLSASSLVATPGATDKRIDLAWSPSASSDVKDYLVYRTTIAGADTTGAQVGVATSTSHFDFVPAYGEWFYRVYSRDHAHNVGPASNEDSAIAVEDSTGTAGPAVTTAIHQNPALSRHATVVVVSDSLLQHPPAVTIVRAADSTDVTFEQIAGSTSAYHGSYEFTGSGAHTILTSIVTAGGDPYDYERDFGASLVPARNGGAAHSVSGVAALEIPAGALSVDTWILAEEATGPDGGQRVRFGPEGALHGEGTVRFAYDPARYPDSRRLFVVRFEDDGYELLPSDVVVGQSVVTARIDRLGSFGLVEDPGYLGDNTVPLRFAVHPNRPNPFRATTSLSYDLPRAGYVRIDVYDVSGRLVTMLRNGPETAGRHTVSWAGADQRGRRVSPGVYFARVSADGGSLTRKMVLLR